MKKFSDLKADNNIVDVIGRFVTLKKKGAEHVGKCPFHDDKHASLMVNEAKQVFGCFACGTGGDVIDFLNEKGFDNKQLVDELSGSHSDTDNEKRESRKPKALTWAQIDPKGQEPKSIHHAMFGDPNKVWAYRNAQGQIIGYVCRFDAADGSKNVLPYVFVTDGNKTAWRWQGFDIPRPLYNLHLLTKYPNATVLIVEGEKTADAAQSQFDPSKVVVTTWVGGSNAVAKTSWYPVAGRRVILYPDNDVQGISAMLHVKKSACLDKTKIIPLDTTKPKGWDCADEDWKPGQLRDLITERMVEDVPPNNGDSWRFTQIGGGDTFDFGVEAKTNEWFFRKVKPTEKPEAPEVPIAPLPIEVTEYEYADYNEHDWKETPPPFENTTSQPEATVGPHWFRFMGYEKSETGTQSFYFYVYRSNQVVRLSPSGMTKSNLLLLAPLNWWEENYPAQKSKFDTDAASDYLIETSISVGIFNPDHARGRGAWIDGKDVVMHTGSHLIINGKATDFNKYKTKYIYEAGYDIGFELADPLQNAGGKQLMELCKLLTWERPISAYFLAGWCVIAPISGALRWRPHIWITGAAGTGKSWIFEKIVKRLLARTAVPVQSETTEAGIRQYLGQDALPVLFDEAEGEDRRAQERIQSVLALMRGASTSDGGMIIKGSAGGTATRFSIRSCFAYASIGISLTQQSDRSRVTILSLQKQQGESGKKQWEAIQKAYAETISEEFAIALQSRTISMLPTILKNADTFASAAAVELGDQRSGDQVGTLLAGAFSLISTKEITFDEALNWIRERDWSEEKASEGTKDEVRLITHLMEKMTTIEVEGRKVDRTIGELVAIAWLGESEDFITRPNANQRLSRLGFRVDPTLAVIYISNTAEFIKTALKDTPWTNNHLSILKRLPGAKPKDQTTFGSYVRSRAIEIPLNTIF